MQLAAKFAIARAELDDALCERHEWGGELSQNPAFIAHQEIDPAQFLARSLGSRVRGWQRIEPLGLDDSMCHIFLIHFCTLAPNAAHAMKE